MAPEPELDRTPSQETSSANPESFAGLVEQVRCLVSEVRGIAHDQATLAALETRQAAMSLVRMLVLGLMLPGLVLGAWLALNWVAVNALAANGLLTTNLALLVAVAVNAVIILLLMLEIRRQSRRLLFPATVNSLRPALPVSPAPRRTSE
jgi:hypothetical protein